MTITRSETLPILPLPSPSSGSTARTENRPVFVNERGRRRLWLHVGAAATTVGGAVYLAALVLVLHAAPNPPQAHAESVTSATQLGPTQAGEGAHP